MITFSSVRGRIKAYQESGKPRAGQSVGSEGPELGEVRTQGPNKSQNRLSARQGLGSRSRSGAVSLAMGTSKRKRGLRPGKTKP